MEDFKSLFVATGVFAFGMLAAAHLRFPNDSAISYLMSSAQASTSHGAKAKPAADVARTIAVAVTQKPVRVATIFTSLPLSAMPLRFEAPKLQAGRLQVRRSPARPTAGNPAAVPARTQPAVQPVQAVAENTVTETQAVATPRFDPLGDLLRGLIRDQAS